MGSIFFFFFLFVTIILCSCGRTPSITAFRTLSPLLQLLISVLIIPKPRRKRPSHFIMLATASRPTMLLRSTCGPTSLLLSREFSNSSSQKLKETVDNAKNDDQESKVTTNVIGATYHGLVHRGRGINALALGDLRKLLQMCKTADEVKYASKAVALYQRKGQDFSEEVNSHFVNACIRGGQPVVAATEFAKYGSRIGAWTTPASFERLVASLEESGEVNESINAVQVLALKGVKLKKESVAVVVKAAASSGDAAIYNKTVESAMKILGAKDGQSVAEMFPLPVVAETVAEGGEAPTTTEPVAAAEVTTAAPEPASAVEPLKTAVVDESTKVVESKAPEETKK